MTYTTTDIHKVHDTFCHETGVTLRLGLGEYSREQAWLRYLHAGFTADDMRLVCRYLRKEIAEGRRMPGALRFRNLVEQLDFFEEELGMARAAQRKPKETAQDKAVAMLRPSAAEAQAKESARPVSELIAELKNAAGMKV